LSETLQPGHGEVERDTVIVEQKCVKEVVVVAQETQLINNVVATGNPLCQPEVGLERKVNNLSQG